MFKKLLSALDRSEKPHYVIVPSSAKVPGLWPLGFADKPKPVLSTLGDASTDALMELCDDFWRSLSPDFDSSVPEGAKIVRSYETYVAAFNLLCARGPESIPWARERLTHPEYDAREAAASLLGTLAKRGLLGNLADAIANDLSALAERPWEVDTKEVQANDAAIQALASIGGPIAIETMCRILKSPQWNEDDLQWSATQVLAQLTEHPFMEAENPVKAAKTWLDPEA
ncbi:MAG: hypothetical protein K1Y02_09960 [Candidatus Hydrogenedentes bacterium]|nr:hypothetical protein [Candidatus Hydrogenedentota bacterium]